MQDFWSLYYFSCLLWASERQGFRDMLHLYSHSISEGQFSWTNTLWRILSGQKNSQFPTVISRMGLISVSRKLASRPHPARWAHWCFSFLAASSHAGSPFHCSNLCYVLAPMPHPRNIHQRIITHVLKELTGNLKGAEKMLYESYVFIHSFNKHAGIFLPCFPCNGDCVRSWGFDWEAEKTHPTSSRGMLELTL